MQLNKTQASDGYLWVRQGLWLFKKNPLAFLMLVFLYVFIAQFAILIPVFGVFAVLLLTPALTVGFMTACQRVIRGEKVLPSVYLVSLKGSDADPLTRKNLLILGIGLLLYIPVAMVMWFAPVLVAWEKMSVAQALFSSWIACWTNKAAFIFYLMIWAALIIAVPFFMEALLDSLGARAVIPFIIPPYSMAALTVMYCSFFATWKACFNKA